MKIKNIFFIVFTLFILLFFPYYLLRVITIMFLLTNLLSFFYTLIIQNSIEIKRIKNIIRSYKGETVQIEFIIENKSILHSGHILIIDNTGMITLSHRGKLFVKLKPREKKKIYYTLDLNSRGEFKIGPISVEGMDPLCFYPWKKTINTYCDIIVYPKIYNFNFINQDGSPIGIFKSYKKIYEDVTQYKNIREYTPGDELKKINWKISARMNKLFSNVYELTFNSDILVLLNLNIEDFPLKYRYYNIEFSIEVTASLIQFYVHKRQKIGLLSNGVINEKPVITTISEDFSHGITMLEYLAKIKPTTNGISLFSILQCYSLEIPERTTIFYITPKVTEKDVYEFYKLRTKGIKFYILIYKDENILKKKEEINYQDTFSYKLQDKTIVYERI